MRTTAIAAAVTFLALAAPAAAQRELQAMPAGVLCRDGKAVAIRVAIDRPGIFTFYLPPDVCAGQTPAAPGPAATRPRSSI